MQTADRSRLFHPQMALTESDFAIYLDLKQECGQNYIHDWAISSMKNKFCLKWHDQLAVRYSGIGYVHIFEGLGGIFSVGSRLTGSL